MTTYRIVRDLDSTDAAYIAGLIDGEGTITLTREHRDENRRLVVSIASTERSMLAFVVERTGCGKITNKRTTSGRHTPSFAYRITNRQALELLRQISPYLRSYKANRAALALTHYLSLTPKKRAVQRGLEACPKGFRTQILGNAQARGLQ